MKSVCSLLLLGLALAAAAATTATPGDSLQTCAAISAPDARLACYDRLAHAPAAPAAPAPSVAPVAPAAAGAAVAPAPATASAAAPLPKESFGLYSSEHPTPPPSARTLQAKVEGLGHNSNGRPTVALENEGRWELDESDPLLAVGDTVTISRASLGSFILTTPTKRIHRVRRLN